jgi:hypothetical protein
VVLSIFSLLKFLNLTKNSDVIVATNDKVIGKFNPISSNFNKRPKMPSKVKEKKKEIDSTSRKLFLFRKLAIKKPGITNKNGVRIDVIMYFIILIFYQF